MARPHPAEAVVNGHETIGSREAYYVPASLDYDPFFCGDDRNRAGIQLFGGVVNIAYNHAVIEEANRPGSVTDSLQGRTEATTEDLVRNGTRPGVHSDANTERDSKLRQDPEGEVGCAYANLRPVISLKIAELGGELVEEAERLRPELFEKPGDHEFALAVTEAHGRLAERESFQTTGRKLVLGAASKGAEVTVYEGEHVASDGIINTVPNTRYDGVAATKDGLPAYNHDAWAAEDVAARLNDPSDENQRQIANLIDTIGTMFALGVDAIAVRR